MSREYVGIDLHRRRSVIVRKNSDGEVLSKVHIDNDPMARVCDASTRSQHLPPPVTRWRDPVRIAATTPPSISKAVA